MKFTRLLIILSLAIALISCSRTEVMDSGCEIGVTVSQYGSAYIGCEAEPFFIHLDSLSSCVTALSWDSVYSENWMPGCSMENLSSDSTTAQLKLTYLHSGMMEWHPMEEGMVISEAELVLANDTVDSGVPPFYGCYEIQYEGRSYLTFIMNRYIGGCFHDELFWQISD